MKDYSKYFSKPEEFVLSYDIKPNGMVIETTTETITIDEVTERYIKQYENILGFQYEALIDKQHKILKDKIDKIIIPFMAVSILLTIICISISEVSSLLGIISCALAVTTCITGAIVSEIYEKNFISQIETYKTYINERKQMEKTLKNIPKLTESFSESTSQIIKINSILKEKDIIEEIFNINLMDKATLKDLKKILEIYSEEQINRNLDHQEKTKKRALFK